VPNFRLILPVLLCFALQLSFAWAAPRPVALLAADDPQKVSSLSATFGATLVRFEVTFADARRPEFAVAYKPQDASLSIDLRNVDIGGVNLPARGPDVLVGSWELKGTSPITASWNVGLNYPVPGDKIRTRTAGNPTRLIVEVSRSYDERMSLPLTRGVHWTRREVRSADGYVLINELEVDLKKDGVALEIVHGNDSLQTTERPTDMAKRSGALALVNGGYFQFGGGGLGLVVEGGQVRKPQVARRPPRTTLGLTNDGRLLMDRVGATGNTLKSIEGSDWSNVRLALGGGPRLVRNGKVDITADAEGLGKNGNNITHTCARTAVAILNDGHLLFVTVSGFQDNHRQGWKLDDLAGWLVARGAVDAMGYDGGGSVAMVIDGQTVSRGWGNRVAERKVANAWAIRDPGPRLMPAKVTLKAATHRANADGKTRVKLVAQVEDAAGAPVPDGTMVYFSTTAGDVTPRATTRKGKAVAQWTAPRAVGEMQVVAFSGLVWGGDAILVESGPPAHLAATLRVVESAPAPSPSVVAETPSPQPTAEVPSAATLEVVLTDRWFNPLSGKPVKVEAEDGSVIALTTDADGVARLRTLAGGRLRVLHGALRPIELVP